MTSYIFIIYYIYYTYLPNIMYLYINNKPSIFGQPSKETVVLFLPSNIFFIIMDICPITYTKWINRYLLLR